MDLNYVKTAHITFCDIFGYTITNIPDTPPDVQLISYSQDFQNIICNKYKNAGGKPISKKLLLLQAFFVYTSRSRCPPFLFIFDERIVKQSKSRMLQNDIYK